MVRHTIQRELRQVWPDVRRQRVLGIGYATPYLRQFRSEAERALGAAERREDPDAAPPPPEVEGRRTGG